MSVSYDKAETRFNTEIRRMLESCTFDPHIDPAGRKYIFTHVNFVDSKSFHGNNSNEHSRPIYLIARTNNTTGKLEEKNRTSYLAIAKEQKKPVFGIWLSNEITYCDTVSVEGVTDVMSDDEAIIAQHQYDQDSIMKIHQDGRYETLTTQADLQSAFGTWRKNTRNHTVKDQKSKHSGEK